MSLTAAPSDTAPLSPPPAGVRRAVPPQQLILAGLLLTEIAIFSGIDLLQNNHFFSLGNLFEVLRLSVELGLLALAMTPVIVTGGIDLSAGSLLGLARS